MARIPLGVASIVALSCCVPQSTPEPSPAPAPPPVQAQPPRPVPAPPPPPATGWQDLPLTAGAWSYDPASGARFGERDNASFVMRCDRAARQMMLGVGDANGGGMTVRTSSVARSLPLNVEEQPNALSYARVGLNDPILDAIAFSRGRFAIEVPGSRALVIPAWPEPARAIEECRG